MCWYGGNDKDANDRSLSCRSGSCPGLGCRPIENAVVVEGMTSVLINLNIKHKVKAAGIRSPASRDRRTRGVFALCTLGSLLSHDDRQIEHKRPDLGIYLRMIRVAWLPCNVSNVMQVPVPRPSHRRRDDDGLCWNSCGDSVQIHTSCGDVSDVIGGG